MNSRSLILLLTFLLLQVGLAWSAQGQSKGDAGTCPMACCQEAQVTCGCGQDLPEPPIPASPAAQGRDLLPQIVWTLIAWEIAPMHRDAALREPQATTARVMRTETAPLTVLHCAFLT